MIYHDVINLSSNYLEYIQLSERNILFQGVYKHLYGHLPPTSDAIKERRTRFAGHCWRSKDEIISDVLLWTPKHGHTNAGRPYTTYINQLCEDTGCQPEDLPRAMEDRADWRERVW